MRYVILDTETTGFEPELGHKLVEIGAVEMIDRHLTGRHFHHYLNPERDSDEGALAVHGLTTEFLSDKPLFKAIAQDLLEFIDGATLLIHNASFDTKFINAELAALNIAPIDTICSIEDTLHMARQMFPVNAIIWTHCVSDWAYPMHIACCMVRCLMRRSSLKCIWQ